MNQLRKFVFLLSSNNNHIPFFRWLCVCGAELIHTADDKRGDNRQRTRGNEMQRKRPTAYKTTRIFYLNFCMEFGTRHNHLNYGV